MSIQIIRKETWTESAKTNLEELIARTGGKKHIALIGEHVYFMTKGPRWEKTGLQNHARHTVENAVRRNGKKLQSIRYPDGSCRIEFRDLEVGWYIPRREKTADALSWEETAACRERIKAELKTKPISVLYLADGR